MGWERFKRLLRDEPLPCAVVDLDALERNQDVLISRLGRDDLTVRMASKSVRVPALLQHLLERSGRFSGLMTYTARETARLAQLGFDDLLLAYPIGRANEADILAELAERGVQATAMIDHTDHVSLLSTAAQKRGVVVPVALDIDASLRLLAGRLHFGVRRSPLRTAKAAVELAQRVRAAPGVELRGIMAYEAQVAGLPDQNPGSRFLDPIRGLVKSRSSAMASERRQAVAYALREAGASLTLVNGGGTGSIASTSHDPSVTEVTAGSGFFCPHLFDHYDGLDLRPAAFFAIGVTRHSDPDWVTCQGGGYPASGGAGPDKLPQVYLPRGLQPLDLEGFGEVQTPLRLGADAPPIRIGDPVICRHAKGGELAERFNEVLLVRGDAIVDRVKTYRGLGEAFL